MGTDSHFRDQQDLVRWIENKLGSNELWGGRQASAMLSREILTELETCFQELEPHIKLSIIQSMVHLSPKTLQTWKEPLLNLIAVAKQDPDDWVETIADIYRQFPDLGLIQCSSKADSFFSRTLEELEKIVSNKVDHAPVDFSCQAPPDFELVPEADFEIAFGLDSQETGPQHFGRRQKMSKSTKLLEDVRKAAEQQKNPLNKKNHALISTFPIKIRSTAKKQDNTLPMKGIPSASALKMSSGFTNDTKKYQQRTLLKRTGGAMLIDIAELPNPNRRRKCVETVTLSSADSKKNLNELNNNDDGAKAVTGNNGNSENRHQSTTDEKEVKGVRKKEKKSAAAAAKLKPLLIDKNDAEMPTTDEQQQISQTGNNNIGRSNSSLQASTGEANHTQMASVKVESSKVEQQPPPQFSLANLTANMLNLQQQHNSNHGSSEQQQQMSTNTSSAFSAVLSSSSATSLYSSNNNISAESSASSYSFLPESHNQQQKQPFYPQQQQQQMHFGPSSSAFSSSSSLFQQNASATTSNSPSNSNIVQKPQPSSSAMMGMDMQMQQQQQTHNQQQQQSSYSYQTSNPNMLAIQQFETILKDANKLTQVSYNLIISFLSGNKHNPLEDKLGQVITLPFSEKIDFEPTDNGMSMNAVHVETFFQMDYRTGEWKRLRKSKALKPMELPQYAHLFAPKASSVTMTGQMSNFGVSNPFVAEQSSSGGGQQMQLVNGRWNFGAPTTIDEASSSTSMTNNPFNQQQTGDGGSGGRSQLHNFL